MFKELTKEIEKVLGIGVKKVNNLDNKKNLSIISDSEKYNEDKTICINDTSENDLYYVKVFNKEFSTWDAIGFFEGHN